MYRRGGMLDIWIAHAELRIYGRTRQGGMKRQSDNESTIEIKCAFEDRSGEDMVRVTVLDFIYNHYSESITTQIVANVSSVP